jgi:hypothetical protein
VNGLHEPASHAPLVLQQEHGAGLGQSIGPDVIECPENALPVVDRQREDDRLGRSSSARNVSLSPDAGRLGGPGRSRTWPFPSVEVRP